MKIRDGLVLRTVGSDHVIVAEGLDALDRAFAISGTDGLPDAVAHSSCDGGCEEYNGIVAEMF